MVAQKTGLARGLGLTRHPMPAPYTSEANTLSTTPRANLLQEKGRVDTMGSSRSEEIPFGVTRQAHHHYFPPELKEEIKRHGKALGVELAASEDGSFSYSFAGGRP